MQFNRSYILIISILGILLLYSYYYFAINSKNPLKLWGNISGNLLKVYYLSMFLSAIGFLLLFYYLIVSNVFTKEDNLKIFISLLGIVIISMFWMPLSLNYLKNNSILLKYLIIIVLLMVAGSTAYLLYILNNITDKTHSTSNLLAFYGIIYFFIHAFFFDTITWSYNFF